MDEPIAIIGLDARFPGSDDGVEGFHDLLLRGRSARSQVPTDRYDAKSFWHPDGERAGSTRQRTGHFLKSNVAAFDAPFFSITAGEASQMDPQQRGILECAYRALENAGIIPADVTGTQTGVYVGCFASDYDRILTRDASLPTKHALGTAVSILSNRISWFFDWRGPSLTIDTACSSSMVALHQACNSLKLGETSMALVGGCNLILSPEMTLKLDAAGILSPDGLSYSFDHRANGYSRGEGFGMVVLKRVSDAILDGDTIRAVIRGCGSGQDGRTPGLTQPSKSAQADLMRSVYSRASLDPSLTRFFEAHGTGTVVGDSIEAGAISEVFTAYRSPDAPLYVGSVKSNIGHLEGAAGIAAIIKAVLTLEDGIIFANATFEKSNPKISESWNLKFPTEATIWPQSGLRRMSVNSFGIGGSNVHVVLDDAYHFLSQHHLFGNHHTAPFPTLRSDLNGCHLNGHTNGLNGSHEKSKSQLTNGVNGSAHTISTNGTNGVNGSAHTTKINGTNGVNGSAHITKTNGTDGVNGSHSNPNTNGTIATSNGNSVSVHHHKFDEVGATPQVMVLSSFDSDGLERQRDLYRQYFKNKVDQHHQGSLLRDISYTLSSKRVHQSWRSCFTVQSDSDALSRLETLPRPLKVIAEPRLAFVFTGQGAQWARMAVELTTFPIFQKALLDAQRYLNGVGCVWSLLNELCKPAESSRINDPEFCQPICTAVQVALVDLLTSWNILPHAVVGHSSGEIAAAYAVGAISRENAWHISFYRGKFCARLSSSLERSHTGMAAIGMNVTQTLSAIERVNNIGDPGTTLEIACMNSPESQTISGDISKIDALVTLLSSEKVFARKLQVELAYHSRYMEPIRDDYLKAITGLPTVTGSERLDTKYFSSTYGGLVPLKKLQNPEYWIMNLRSTVRFSEAVQSMLGSKSAEAVDICGDHKLDSCPITDLLEIGPHSALKGPLRTILTGLGINDTIKYHSMVVRNSSAAETALEAAGALFCRGHVVNLETINDHGGRVVSAPRMLTNLPSYAFDHTKDYWHESRLDRNTRFPSAARHDLLGAPVPDWNVNNAVWRNYIRLSESPWVEDHQVSGEILYPAAGMLVMAIEASLQLAVKDKTPKAFKFKEVSFHQALRLSAESGQVETHFYLRPHWSSVSLTESTWNEFQLFTHENNEWREHCRGLVTIEYEAEYNPVDGGEDDKKFRLKCRQDIEDAQLECTTEISRKKVYRAFRDIGLEFGDTFQTLQGVQVGANFTSMARVDGSLAALKKAMPESYLQTHHVHPTTLDGVIQASILPLAMSLKDACQAVVPTYIGELWVSADPSIAHDSYQVASRMSPVTRASTQCSITALHSEHKHPMVVISDIALKLVPGEGAHSFQDLPRRSFNIDWKPDPTFVRPDEAEQVFGLPMSQDSGAPDYIADCELLCLAYMRQYLDRSSEQNAMNLPAHFRKYNVWLKQTLGKSQDTSIGLNLLEEKVIARNTPEGKLVVAVGRVLTEIIQGSKDPLEILFSDGLAEDVYRDGLGGKRAYAQLSRYIDALAHQNPAMEILEIGAGTGGATKPVMATLTQQGSRYKHYTFTDISPAFLEAARTTFEDQLDRMSFKLLNVERSPADQDFATGQYDVVIGANVLHATKNIDETLKNARQLLKPGGKLILFEITDPQYLVVNFVFGLLPGWWLSEEAHREGGPLLSAGQWGDHLIGNGFTGLDVVLNDFPTVEHQHTSVLVSSVFEAGPDAKSGKTCILLTQDASPLQQSVAEGLLHVLEQEGTCINRLLHQVSEEDLLGSTCIILGELDVPILSKLDADDFKALKHAVKYCQGLVWATRGGVGSIALPEMELITGLAKGIRGDKPGFATVCVSFEEATTAMEIIDRMIQLLKNPGGLQESERAFRVFDKVVHTPRLVDAKYLAEHIEAQTRSLSTVEDRLGNHTDEALKLEIVTLGLLDTLRFANDPIFATPLGEYEVEIKVMCCGMNFHDLASMLGKIDESPLGLEASGIVTRCGPKTSLKIGDEVFGLFFDGSLKTYARTHESFLATMRPSLSWTEAAAVPIAFTTAYTVLHELGTARSGDTILMHSAAGGFGQAVIQLAQHAGLEVFVTVGSTAKRDFMEATYNIPRDHIFSSRDLTFKTQVLLQTNSRGVDIVINTLSGEALQASWDCVAPFGRFVELGLKDININSRIPMKNFERGCRFESLDLTYFARHDPVRAHRAFQRTVAVVVDELKDSIHSLPVTSYPYSQTQEAFRFMQSGRHIGKLVLQPQDDDLVTIVPSQLPVCYLDQNASYVIAGGFGGLGRSIARWMVSQGVENLILLSRRGESDDSAIAFVTELRERCRHVAAPSCDVTDVVSLKRSIADCMEYMPPVKGCIQGSMVLRDNRFDDMTIDEWNQVIQPKVAGSRNLVEALGTQMDFFIMLSSTVGLTGHNEQSNYVAGNTFQDAFARHLRHNHEMNAVSICLPVVLDIGFVAEKVELMDSMLATGWAFVNEQEFIAALDYYCRPMSHPQPLEISCAVPRFWLPQYSAQEGAQLPAWRHDPLFSHLVQMEASRTEKINTKAIKYISLLSTAASTADAAKIALDALLLKLSRILSIDSDKLEPNKALHAYGVDSLVAVELRSWFYKELGAELSVFEMTNNLSVSQLAELAASRSRFVPVSTEKREPTQT